jgi:hypothetical protein
MVASERLIRFIDMNASGRVLLLCRSFGIFDQKRIFYYTRALRAAMHQKAAAQPLTATEIQRYLNKQVAYLGESLKNLPPPTTSSTYPARPESATDEPEASPKTETAATTRRLFAQPRAASKDKAERFEDARKALKKILQDDCVTLGLIDAERADALTLRMAGRPPRDTEREILAEVQNNLHAQIRAYLKQHKGGPWPTPKQQEEVRQDIENTYSLSASIALARQLLRECTEWEKNRKKGLFRSILSD